MWKWLTLVKAICGGVMMLFASIVHIAMVLIYFGAIVLEVPLTDGIYSTAAHSASAVFMLGWLCWLSARMDGVEQKIEHK